MKTIRKLNIKDWSGYFFKEMANILDIDPEYFMINDFKGCKDGSILFNLCYCSEDSVPHIVSNNTECIFIRNGIHSCLIFCKSEKNKKVLNCYIKIFDDYFIMGKDFVRFKFRTDNELVYNKKINIPVCVISLSCVVKKGDIYYPQFKLQDCLYESNEIQFR